MIPYILTEKSLTAVLSGKAHSMNSTHPSWEKAKKALREEDWTALEGLFDVQVAVKNYLDEEAHVEVRDGQIVYKGETVHNLVVEKIINFMREGLPYKPLIKFLSKLMENPSHRAVEELYSFLEHKNMPLTPEGNFLAYKGVKHDYTDVYSGKFVNTVGAVLEMRRSGVCDDARNGCSFGFHAGTYEYAKGYASNGGHLLVVEINPADVVSVPHDCECQKLRTCKYQVVNVYETIERPALSAELYDSYSDEEDEGDFDDDEEGYQGKVDQYNEGWFAGYKAAKGGSKN